MFTAAGAFRFCSAVLRRLRKVIGAPQEAEDTEPDLGRGERETAGGGLVAADAGAGLHHDVDGGAQAGRPEEAPVWSQHQIPSTNPHPISLGTKQNISHGVCRVVQSGGMRPRLSKIISKSLYIDECDSTDHHSGADEPKSSNPLVHISWLKSEDGPVIRSRKCVSFAPLRPAPDNRVGVPHRITPPRKKCTTSSSEWRHGTCCRTSTSTSEVTCLLRPRGSHAGAESTPRFCCYCPGTSS